MNTITVLHLLKSSSYSGAENVVCQIIDMFKSEQNIRMIYCSTKGEIGDVLNKRLIEYCPLEKFTLSQVKKAIRQTTPDIIHAHDFSASVYATLTTRIPTICHLHNNVPWMRSLNEKTLMFLIAGIKSKKIITVSNSVMDEYIFGKLIRKKTVILGNPINKNSIKKRSDEFSVLTGEYDIAYLGRLSPEKNPLRFIRLMDELNKRDIGIKAIMIGDGELRTECEEALLTSGLKDTVKIAGFIENPYVTLSKAKLLCMPSDWEGFGLAAAEALALGVPVVCSNVGGLPDIVTSDCGKLCKTDEEFLDEMQKLLTDEKYQKTKSKVALSRAEELSNIDEYQKSLNELYGTLVQ